jgi:hypothetical protein
MEDKIIELCNLITKEQQERLRIDKLDCEANLKYAVADYIINKKYTYINIGSAGRYMIDNASGEIYGIKSYGVIHRGHFFGNLETIKDYYWGDYRAYKKC